MIRSMLRSELVNAVLGLWLVPFTPLAVAVLIAWGTSWGVPSLVMVGFLLGWPVVWFRWTATAPPSPPSDEENAE